MGRSLAAVFLGVVPGQEEIHDAPGLAGVASGDCAQASEGFERSGFGTAYRIKIARFLRRGAILS
jgi:hypothetical protein